MLRYDVNVHYASNVHCFGPCLIRVCQLYGSPSKQGLCTICLLSCVCFTRGPGGADAEASQGLESASAGPRMPALSTFGDGTLTQLLASPSKGRVGRCSVSCLLHATSW
jgi:hypothetical protein